VSLIYRCRSALGLRTIHLPCFHRSDRLNSKGEKQQVFRTAIAANHIDLARDFGKDPDPFTISERAGGLKDSFLFSDDRVEKIECL